jgi:hypothetical protein
MQLPAEIRDTIYHYTLADASGINLMGTFKHKRRTVQRISAEGQSRIQDLVNRRYRFRSSNMFNNDELATFKEQTVLVPSLLAVCKQIYQEGRDILYGNEFILTDSFALYSFLINLGPSGCKHLKHLRLIEWGYGRGMKGYNHACFVPLVWATNLETLRLESTPSYHKRPKTVATQLYRDAFPWLEAVGTAKGKVDAAADVLQLALDVFNPSHRGQASQDVVSGEEKRDQFREELSILLGAQQKRVMVANTEKKKKKKKKVAKVDADDS